MRKIYTPCVNAKRIIITFCFALFLFINGKAQIDINIGTGTVGNTGTTYPAPLQDWYEGSRSQYLFKASELSAAGMSPGNITHIKWNVTGLNTFNGIIDQYGIKMLSTTATALNLTTWETGATTVYGLTDYTPVLGVNTFVFNTPFFWNGTDNIIVEICNGSATSTFTNNVTVPWTTGLGFNASHTYRADNLGNLCATTTTTNTGTADTRPNTTFGWISAVTCTGTPTAGVAASTITNILCAGTPFTLSLTGATLASSLTYQWQSSLDNVTFTNITGATASAYNTTQALPSVYYRCIVTCTPSALSATSTSIQITSVSGPTYATIPYAESFENNWVDACATRDIPNSFWKNTPVSGNNSWRRNDDFAVGGWTSNSGAYTPPASIGNFSARFHSYNTSNGISGTFDLYLNCNTGSLTKRLLFDYINISGNDSLSVQISTDGGTTFYWLDSVKTSTVWNTKGIFFNSTSATTVIRFKATSDFGVTDIGLDNLVINNWADCTGTPTGGTAIASPTTVCLNDNITLTVNGASDGNGIAYQWQVSTNNVNWTNIVGATNYFTTATQTVTSYYRCVISCNLTGTSSNSTAVTVSSTSLVGGTFTINKNLPTSFPGGTNFASFNDAYNAIKCGVNAPVIFNVVSGTGPYSEQLIMSNVPGASKINTITFNGNGNTLSFSSSNTNERAVIKLKNTKHIIFDSLTIDASAGTYGFGVQLFNNADSNIIRKCNIITSTTSTLTNYAGVVISGSETSATGTGTTLCDNNIISGNTITGGYYGITLTATFAGGANGYNKLINNKIEDVYFYGIYVSASYNTLIESNSISRPTRTTLTTFYGIYFASQNNSASISKNRIFTPFGANVTNASAFYGINFATSSASAGNENIVSNNLIYDVQSNGIQQGITNTGSSNVWYFHNTVSLDNTTSTGTAVTRGFTQTTAAGGIYFYNNIFTITRGGTGIKHCVYLGNNLFIGDNNNYYINSIAGTNAVGYYTSNRNTLQDWKTATNQDANSFSVNPVYANPAIGDFTPNNAGIDNKGLYLGIDTDIKNAPRSTTTPDIGAYEFVPPPCLAPPTPGATAISASVICQNNPVTLGLGIGAFGSTQRFQWQTATNIAGPYTNFGSSLLVPDTTFLAQSTFYFRCAVTCASATEYSNPVLLTVNPALPAGTYTINYNSTTTYTGPGTGTNFKTFNDAKVAMNCGVLGAVTFNVIPNSGPYNEQLVLDSIQGTSLVKTITFNGNGNTIAFASNNSLERAVIKLRGADYITFDSLTIDASAASTYGYGVQLINNADTNTFRKCTILANTNSTNSNYAGVIINSSESGTIALGNTWCDGNILDRNTIIGGFYGITLVGSATQLISNNIITNNLIQDFYNYGIYAAGTYNTLIEGNRITRPTRTVITTAYGMYFSSAFSSRMTISKNRIYNLFGGAPTNTSGLYGIYHNNIDAVAGNEVNITNNLFYNLDGNGVVYGMYNAGSDNVRYYHNSVAIDDVTATAAGQACGFYQTTTAIGLEFKNNIITIRRGGNGTKQAIYLGSPTTTEIDLNYNNYFINAGGSNNFIGYSGTNYATLAAWKTATNKDANSLNYDPLWLDLANGNLKPQMLPLDNKGTGVGVSTDILNILRNTVTPDMGAYEFVPPSCPTPLVAGTATVTPNAGVCLEVPITLNLTGNSPIGQITFQWQSSPDGTTWTNLGPLLYSPQYDTISSTNNYYRCILTCGTSTVTSTTTQVTLNNILVGGTYTINAAQPTTWPSPGGTNFQTFQSAVNALQCGIQGSVIFNVVAATYNEQIRVPYIPGTSASKTVTFQSANGNPSSAILTYNSTLPASNYTLKLDSCKYFFFKNLTINATNLTNGRVVEFANTASNDSLVNCIINAPITTNTSNTLAAVYATGLKGNKIVIKGNTINNGSAGIHFSGTSAASSTIDHVIDGNTINAAYYYGVYSNFTNRLDINNNTINISDPSFSSVYGIYSTDMDSSFQIRNNTINISNSTSIVYGILLNNSDGSAINAGRLTGNDVIATTGNTNTQYGIFITNSPYLKVLNNAVVINTTGVTSYGIYNNNSGNADYYNNSVNSLNASTGNNYSAYILNTSASGLNIKNNIFANNGGGKALFIQNTSASASDYNMLFTTGAILAQRVTPTNTTYATLLNWQSGSFLDQNSISYIPAFMSGNNLRPNLSNSDVWAMHGRGVQIVDNNYDHDNNSRPTTLLTGVPDLGAYEFYPTALPTVLLATPASPSANTEQTFSYGTDTVMKIKWGTTVPPSVQVRRYSGVVPTGLAAGNLDSMYFYTKVDIPGGGSYDYDAKLFYINPWLGSIPSVYQLGLGKTTPGNAWIVGFTSRNDVPKKMIYQTNVNYLDKFTGLVNPYAPPVLPDKDSSNRGKRFWVAYAANQLAAGTTQQMVLYLSAQTEAANVQVKINGTNWVRNYFVAPNTVTATEYLPKAGVDNAFLPLAGLFDRGISITSDVPIVAYAHCIGSTSSGASMLMPVGVWGYEYKTLGINQTWGTGGYSFFYVIADNDNTVVEVNPTVAVSNSGLPTNTATQVILNKGQVLQVLASSTTTELSGSTVKSVPNSSGKCFPIAVFSGTSRTQINIPTGCSSGGDFIMQQNFPSTAWGKKYLTAPTSFSTNASGYATNTYRIAVKDPTTVVKRNGSIISGLVNNHYYQYSSNTADFIDADKPIMVAQFTSSGTCLGGSGVGDPEMFYISPIAQGINNVGFYRNNKESITTNYLTMIVPTNGLSSLQIIDGNTVVTPDVVYPHPQNSLVNVNYSVVIKRWASAQEQVRVTCDSNFTGITYGLGSVESYGYNMGTKVKNLQAGGQINNTLSSTGTSTEYTCAGAPFNFTMLLPVIPTSIKWKFSAVPNLTPNVDVTIPAPVPSGTVIINGELFYQFALSQTYMFSAPGLYPVQVTYTHPTIESCDNTQTDVIYVQVIPSPPISFNINFSGCQNGTALFTADNVSPSGVNVSQWSWTFNNGTTATGQTANFTYTTAGTFSEKLHVVTADGCVRDTIKQVIVNPLPTINVVTDSIALCTGANATFTIQSPVTGTTYNWYSAATGGTLLGTGTTFTLNNVTTTTTVFIEAISSASCISANRKRVKAQIFTPLAQAIVTVASSNATSVTFSWAAVSGAASYLVSVNGGAFVIPSSGATGLTHTVTGLGTLQSTNIIVQAIGFNSCQTSNSGSVSGCSDSPANASPDNQSICVGNNAIFNVTSPQAGITYTWFNTASGGTSLATGNTYTALNVISSTSFYVQQSSASCVASTRKELKVLVLTPLAKPIVTVITTQTTPTSLTFSWAAVTGATGYEVSINNGTTWSAPSSGSNGLTHTVSGLQPNTSVTILVKALGTISCQNSISDPVTGKTLIDQIYIPNAFTPNGDGINDVLKVYGYVITNLQMMIFNQWGEKVFETSNQAIGWNGTYKGKPLPAGVYMYVCKMTLLNGTTLDKKGSINLIR